MGNKNRITNRDVTRSEILPKLLPLTDAFVIQITVVLYGFIAGLKKALRSLLTAQEEIHMHLQ